MSSIEEFKAVLSELKRIPKTFSGDSSKSFSAGRIEDLYSDYRTREKALIEQLYDLANSYVISKKDISDTWTKADEISELEFHTQGFGARKYARAKADRIAHRIESFGIPTEVRIVERKAYNEDTYDVFEVYVKCTYDLMIMLKYKDFDIDDDIAFLVKSGVNPRVFYPFLPYVGKYGNL